MKDQDLTRALDIAMHRLRIRDKIKDVISEAFLLAAKHAKTTDALYDLADLTEFALGVVDGKLPKLPTRDLVNIIARICELDFGRGGKPLSPEMRAAVESELRAA
jgi:hypothetical protein